ncbi:MAG: long-chain fatty acid--CoA ligase [Chloracidobacterium sp.]|nr:long-chain fatty acid--CoA ligase [Chloracidobacterium sp.]
MIEAREQNDVTSAATRTSVEHHAEPKTLPELFLRSASEFDLPNALNYKKSGEWQAISSAEIIERAENIALGLYSLGLRKGDRVAILAPNSPDWTLVDAGCQFAGVIDVPIYTTLAPDSVQFILNDSEARIIFLQDEESCSRLMPAIQSCKSIEKIVLFTENETDDECVIFLEKLESAGQHLRVETATLVKELRDDVEPTDIATLIYTSGTTGEPKGVMLTHANLISNVLDASEKYAFDGRDISLSVLPLSHVFERTGMYVYIRYGMCVHFAESIEKVPDNLKEVRPTIFIGVPRIFEKVFERARLKAAQAGRVHEMIFDWAIEVAKEYATLKERGEPIPMTLMAQHAVADKVVYQKLRDFFGGRVRFCITGGAALPDEIFLIFTGAGILIMQGYGLTETSPVISSNNPTAVRVGTVGKPIRNVKVRIAADGEIEVTGPGVMLGYYHRDEATKEAFTDDGWFRTGDIGNIDGDGYLCITDRKKELFKTSGGKYIAPSHIEQMLRSSRFVNQAVLVGNERKFPAALIVPNFEMLESYAKLKELDIKTPREFCQHPRILDLFTRQIESYTPGLSQFERVKKFALLEHELTVENGELTPTLKIKRRVIDTKYQSIIDELYKSAMADQ